MPDRPLSTGKQEIDAVLILDKPAGITSNQALQKVKRMLRARKAGHCGSLDPMATGVLPICLGQATKFAGYLLGADKTYRASCRLGQTTTTADAEGELLDEREIDATRAQIEAVLNRFRGDIEQVPPMYSALKQQGRRLYELARAGEQVERPPRPVTIYRLDLLGYEAPIVDFEVACSKGTYVRSLAQDIGEALGCGAHLTVLRRTEARPFTLADAITLDALNDAIELGRLEAHLRPVWSALEQFAQLELDRIDGERIRQGKVLSPAAPPAAGLYRLMAENGEFIGLGEVDQEGRIKAKRLMNTVR